MSQWGATIKIAGVTVLPHVATNVFDPIIPSSLIDNFTVIDTDVGADVERAQAILEPFRGKPHSDLMAFFNEMCSVAT